MPLGTDIETAIAAGDPSRLQFFLRSRFQEDTLGAKRQRGEVNRVIYQQKQEAILQGQLGIGAARIRQMAARGETPYVIAGGLEEQALTVGRQADTMRLRIEHLQQAVEVGVDPQQRATAQAALNKALAEQEQLFAQRGELRQEAATGNLRWFLAQPQAELQIAGAWAGAYGTVGAVGEGAVWREAQATQRLAEAAETAYQRTLAGGQWSILPAETRLQIRVQRNQANVAAQQARVEAPLKVMRVQMAPFQRMIGEASARIGLIGRTTGDIEGIYGEMEAGLAGRRKILEETLAKEQEGGLGGAPIREQLKQEIAETVVQQQLTPIARTESEYERAMTPLQVAAVHYGATLSLFGQLKVDWRGAIAGMQDTMQKQNDLTQTRVDWLRRNSADSWRETATLEQEMDRRRADRARLGITLPTFNLQERGARFERMIQESGAQAGLIGRGRGDIAAIYAEMQAGLAGRAALIEETLGGLPPDASELITEGLKQQLAQTRVQQRVVLIPPATEEFERAMAPLQVQATQYGATLGLFGQVQVDWRGAQAGMESTMQQQIGLMREQIVRLHKTLGADAWKETVPLQRQIDLTQAELAQLRTGGPLRALQEQTATTSRMIAEAQARLQTAQFFGTDPTAAGRQLTQAIGREAGLLGATAVAARLQGAPGMITERLLQESTERFLWWQRRPAEEIERIYGREAMAAGAQMGAAQEAYAGLRARGIWDYGPMSIYGQEIAPESRLTVEFRRMEEAAGGWAGAAERQLGILQRQQITSRQDMSLVIQQATQEARARERAYWEAHLAKLTEPAAINMQVWQGWAGMWQAAGGMQEALGYGTAAALPLRLQGLAGTAGEISAAFTGYQNLLNDPGRVPWNEETLKWRGRLTGALAGLAQELPALAQYRPPAELRVRQIRTGVELAAATQTFSGYGEVRSLIRQQQAIVREQLEAMPQQRAELQKRGAWVIGPSDVVYAQQEAELQMQQLGLIRQLEVGWAERIVSQVLGMPGGDFNLVARQFDPTRGVMEFETPPGTRPNRFFGVRSEDLDYYRMQSSLATNTFAGNLANPLSMAAGALGGDVSRRGFSMIGRMDTTPAPPGASRVTDALEKAAANLSMGSGDMKQAVAALAVAVQQLSNVLTGAATGRPADRTQWDNSTATKAQAATSKTAAGGGGR